MYISLTGSSANKDAYIKRSYHKGNGKTATAYGYAGITFRKTSNTSYQFTKQATLWTQARKKHKKNYDLITLVVIKLGNILYNVKMARRKSRFDAFPEYVNFPT